MHEPSVRSARNTSELHSALSVLALGAQPAMVEITIAATASAAGIDDRIWRTAGLPDELFSGETWTIRTLAQRNFRRTETG